MVILFNCQSLYPTFHIGVLAPKSGEWEILGKDAEVMLQIVLEQINFYLAPYSRSARFHLLDTEGNPDIALEKLKQLHAQGITIVIGPFLSDAVEAVQNYAFENGIVLISPSSKDLSLQTPDNTFRMTLKDTYQAAAISDRVFDAGFLNALIISDTKYRYLASLSAAIEERLSDYHIEIDTLHTEAVPSDAIKDMEAVLNDKDPDKTAVILLVPESYALSLFRLIPEDSFLRTFKWYANEIVIDSVAVKDDLAASGFAARTRLEGFSFSDISAPDELRIYPEMVRELFRERKGRYPAPFALQVWDSAWIAAEAMLRTESDFTGISLREQIQALYPPVMGATGSVVFDDGGDRQQGRLAHFVWEISPDGTNSQILSGFYLVYPPAPPVYSPVDSILQKTASLTIPIGMLTSLSGDAADLGREILNGAELAIDYINKIYAGTDTPVDFYLAVEDDESIGIHAPDAVSRLFEKGADIIIGPVTSDALEALSLYGFTGEGIFISPSSTAISARGQDRVIRLASSDVYQSKALSELMAANEHTHVAIFARNDPYGRDFADAFAEVFEGKTIIVFYPPGTSDFQMMIQSAEIWVEQEKAADAAVMMVCFEEGISLLEQLPEESLLAGFPWYATEALAGNRTLISRVGRKAASLPLTCSSPDSRGFFSFLPQIHTFDYLYYHRFGKRPGSSYSLTAFDAVCIAAKAHILAGSLASRRQLWDGAVSLHPMLGISSHYVLDEYHDQSEPAYIFQSVRRTIAGPDWQTEALYSEGGLLYPDGNLIEQPVIKTAFAIKTESGKRTTARGDQIPYSLFVPERRSTNHPLPPYPAIVLTHGFARSRWFMRNHALYLANRGIIVLTPDIVVNIVDDLSGYQALADNTIDHLEWLVKRSETEGDLLYAMVDQNQMGLAGHSAGGGGSLLAAITNPDIAVAVCTLDGVPHPFMNVMSREFPALNYVSLRSEPETFNLNGSILNFLRGVPFPVRDIKVIGASHLDPENPSDFSGKALIGGLNPDCQYIYKRLLYLFMQDAFGIVSIESPQADFEESIRKKEINGKIEVSWINSL